MNGSARLRRHPFHEICEGYQVQATGRLTIQVQDVAGEPVSVEVVVRLDTVELWSHERCRAVFERSALASWFQDPAEIIACDEVSFGFRAGQYYVLVDPVAPWRQLSGTTVQQLQDVLT